MKRRKSTKETNTNSKTLKIRNEKKWGKGKQNNLFITKKLEALGNFLKEPDPSLTQGLLLLRGHMNRLSKFLNSCSKMSIWCAKKIYSIKYKEKFQGNFPTNPNSIQNYH